MAQQNTGPTPMDTFRALAPPEGMKFTPLFATPVKDDGQRFARIEQSVQALRNDFDTVTPTLVRLAAIEKDIRDLVGQLRTLNDGGPIVEAAPVAPVAAAPTPLAAPAVTPTRPVPSSTTVTTQTKTERTVSAPANVTAAVKAPVPVAPVPVAPVPVAPVAAAKPATTVSKTTTTTTTTTSGLPGKDVTAGGTEAATAQKAAADTPAPSLPVTPEAAPTGKLPPEGAASPNLPAAQKPMDLTPVLSDAPAAAAKPATAPAAPVTMGPIIGDVRGIRIGDHIDKTRIVLDVTAKAPFKVRLENEGRRMVIELPQYAWKTEATWNAMSAALVAGYRYADGALVLDLLAPASIRQQTSLPAGDGAGPRIMIDIFAPLVHVE
jgi:hypothetical protein